MGNKIAIISDFSKTLSSKTNPTTWSVFAKSGLLGEDYTKDRDFFYNLYHDYEVVGDIQKTKEWWIKHIELFIKYGLTQNLINKITSDKNYFNPREGLKDFIEYIQKNNIDLYIISSGISDFIESFLLNNGINKNKINIIGSKLIFDKDLKVVGYDKNSIITTLNKNQHNLDLSIYDKIILLGDDLSDLKMYNQECLKIGFCNQNTIKGYDKYLSQEGSLIDVLEYLK